MPIAPLPLPARQPWDLGAEVTAGRMGSEAAVAACLERIDARDGELGAFVALRREAALAEARRRDAEPPRGPLHGVPFAVKDVFDTADLPTAYGSPHYQGHQPTRDAAAVALLRAAGAVLLGKVSTVEFASVGAIPETRNPHDPTRTAGGSSSGSGAAVGAGLVPLATATQTGGSTVRPAAFCGAAAMKPTYGRVPIEGLKPYAPSLDTAGWIAASVDLLARAAAACGIHGASDAPARTLRFGVFETPYWDEASPEARAALQRTADLLTDAGHAVEGVPAPDGSEGLNGWQDTIMHGEGSVAFQAEWKAFGDALHPRVLAEAENRLGITPRALAEAADAIAALRPRYDAALGAWDAWLAPAVPGEAPPWSPDDSGSANFNRLFTALHVPCVALPGFAGPRGLPVGVQLVGARGADTRLLAAARVVEAVIGGFRGGTPADQPAASPA